MAKSEIHAGICGFKTEVETRMEEVGRLNFTGEPIEYRNEQVNQTMSRAVDARVTFANSEK